MADSIRGDGLFLLDAALAALVENPERLDRARKRFGEDAPPSYRRELSATTTRSPSPDLRTEEQRRREEREYRLRNSYYESWPRCQFSSQMLEEARRIAITTFRKSANFPDSMPESALQPYGNMFKLAKETVTKRWIEQGIWNDKWNNNFHWTWKHEEPLELDSDSETESESQGKASQSSCCGAIDKVKPRQPRSEDELQRKAERRAVREREREASRPFHQFVYQVSKERERIQNEAGSGGLGASGSADINTQAYEKVKNTWIKRRIWRENWGILPGMSWRHEQPLEDVLAEEMGPDPTPPANPSEGDGPGAAQASVDLSAVKTFKGPDSRSSLPDELQNGDVHHPPSAELAPSPQRFLTDSEEDAHSVQGRKLQQGESAPSRNGGCRTRQASFNSVEQIFGAPPATPSGGVNIFRRLSTASLNHSSIPGLPAESRNSDAHLSHSEASSQRHLAESGEDACSVAEQEPEHGERISSPNKGRDRPTRGTVLGPACPAKVSKTPSRRKGLRRRQGGNGSELSSRAQPPLTELDLPDKTSAPVATPLRRSIRLQETKAKAPTDPATVASVDALNGMSLSKRRRTTTRNPNLSGSTKPKGVSKGQRQSTRRRKKK